VIGFNLFLLTLVLFKQTKSCNFLNIHFYKADTNGAIRTLHWIGYLGKNY